MPDQTIPQLVPSPHYPELPWTKAGCSRVEIFWNDRAEPEIVVNHAHPCTCPVNETDDA